MEAILVNHQPLRQHSESHILATLARMFLRLLGCWHLDMSRPFTHDAETYRVCLGCGARREFDVTLWQMKGSYYFAPPAGVRFSRR
jgi:hypothetical protein